MKGTRGILGEAEVSVIWVSRGQCPFSQLCPLPPKKPRKQQAGAIFETPSTWLTVFDPPWRSAETLPHPVMGPPKLLFHMNGWS